MRIAQVNLDPNILISQGLEGVLIALGVIVGCWMIARALQNSEKR